MRWLARVLLSSVLWGAVLSAQAPAPAASAPGAPPALTEAQQLRVENHALKLRLAQVETQLQQLLLSQERTRLETDLATTHPGFRMDWQTLQLVAAVPAAPTAPAPPASPP